MNKLILKFKDEEFGNAVIDWVVLMAGMVLMAIAVVTTITANVDDITDATMDRMEEMQVNPV